MKKKSSKATPKATFDESIDHLWGDIKAPGPLLLALEGRAPWEYGAALASWPLLRNAPTGDGHTVLVFPGLVAGDFSTAPLRNFLNDRGFDAQGWELGVAGAEGGELRCTCRPLAISSLVSCGASN